MRRFFLITILNLCFLFIVFPSYASDIYGWYKNDNDPKFSSLLKITESRFDGLNYKILKSDGMTTEISITNSKKPTIINKIDDETIKITTVNGKTVIYKLVTHDINLSKKDIAKMDQNAK